MKVYLREQNKKPEVYRKEGKIPGVLYGPNVETKLIYAEEKEFNKFYKKHESGLFSFEFEEQTLQGLLREIQIHPINYKIIHFDIYVPSLEKEIEAKVVIEFIGEAPVLKKGGILNFNLNEIELSALPQNLPDKITVDLSGIDDIGQSIYVNDIKLPDNVKVLIDKNTVIVTAVSNKIEENKS